MDDVQDKLDKSEDKMGVVGRDIESSEAETDNL